MESLGELKGRPTGLGSQGDQQRAVRKRKESKRSLQPTVWTNGSKEAGVGGLGEVLASVLDSQ